MTGNAETLPNLQGETHAVFSLTVLVEGGPGATKARAANLPLDAVQASSIRVALGELVQRAKELIRQHPTAEVPWIDPPSKPTDSESQFIVPLHL